MADSVALLQQPFCLQLKAYVTTINDSQSTLTDPGHPHHFMGTFKSSLLDIFFFFF